MIMVRLSINYKNQFNTILIISFRISKKRNRGRIEIIFGIEFAKMSQTLIQIFDSLPIGI